MLFALLIVLAILGAAWVGVFGIVKLATLFLGITFNIAIVNVIWFIFFIALVGLVVLNDTPDEYNPKE